MYENIETITNDNVLELNDELSILIIGIARIGKTPLLKKNS